VKLKVTNAQGLFESLSNPAHLMQLGTEWRLFQTKRVADHSLAVVAGLHQADYGFIPSSLSEFCQILPSSNVV